jgi:hypothetical protein
MGVIVVTCPPNSGKDISTRIYVDENDFRNLPDAVIKLHCPHCGQEHQWKPSQASLVDGLPPSQWVKTTSQFQQQPPK